MRFVKDELYRKWGIVRSWRAALAHWAGDFPFKLLLQPVSTATAKWLALWWFVLPGKCMPAASLHSPLLQQHYPLRCFRSNIKFRKNNTSLTYSPIIYAFFWVITKRLNFIYRRFGTLCLFHLRRQIGVEGLGLSNVGVLIREKVWLEKIFDPNIFLYQYPNISQNYSFYIPTYLWRWNRQSVPKRRHTKFRRRGNYPEESIRHSEHGESLKSRMFTLLNHLIQTAVMRKYKLLSHKKYV